MIHGIQIILYEVEQTDTDDFGAPVYQETPVIVDNVLVAPASANEILDSVNLYGKKAVYSLGIPKGDTHAWEDRKVSFFGQDFRVFGKPVQGIDDLIPLAWNKKVMVEAYE